MAFALPRMASERCLAFMAEHILTVLIVFTAPIPLWLIFLHLAVQREALFYRCIVYPSIGVMWGVLGYVAFRNQDLLFARRFQTNLVLEVLGVFLMCGALIIDWKVLKTLGLKRLMCLSELQRNGSPGELITTGIYAYARHPRYVEFLLWSLGLFLIFGYLFLLVFTLYLFFGFWQASYSEEAELVQRFGRAYRDYQERVPRFFIRLK